MNCVVFDIETTGLSKYTNKITEIAGVKVQGNKIVNRFQTLINPECHIPSFITRLTGIDNQLVKDSPLVEEVLPKVKRFFGNDFLVGHNVSFDVGFMSHNFKQHLNQDLENKAICTMRLANRIPLEFENRKLGTLCRHFNISNEQEHRAMGDAMATFELLQRFKNILYKNGIKCFDDIHSFSKRPARICREKILI